MIFDVVGPTAANRNEAVLVGKPAKYSDVRCLELPNRVAFDLDTSEVPTVSKTVTDYEAIKYRVNLFNDRKVNA